MEVVIASSPVDSGISCWDLHSGQEQLRYRACTSPPHGLTCVGSRLLASSQLRDSSSSSSGSILYWSWNKPHAEVKSFPAEPINPLISNSWGSYIIGGGSSGDIYFWEVSTGRLLKKWHAHYRAITRLLLSEDESLLISGSEDGSVRVWSLIMVFDEIGNQMAKNAYEHNFAEHTLRVTDVVMGYGGCNALIISASEDRTCKVWSISRGVLLRTVKFPCIIDALALDPGEHVFYAGGRDGKIYIAALNAENTSNSSYGLHIIGALSDHSKAVTCLAFSMDGKLLVSGLVDGTIRIWDSKSRQVIRVFKHSKGPVNNILVVRQPPQTSVNAQAPKKHASLVPPPLDKYVNSTQEDADLKPKTTLHAPCNETLDARYLSTHVMMRQIIELQQQGSSAASEMELEKLRVVSGRSQQTIQQLMKMNKQVLDFCVNEIVGDDNIQSCNGNTV